MIHALSKILFVVSFATIIYIFTRDILCIWEVIIRHALYWNSFLALGIVFSMFLVAIKFFGITFIVVNMEF